MRQLTFFGILFLAVSLMGCEKIAVVYLVRHAEKLTGARYGNNPPLTNSGQARAEDLADHLADAGIDIIIVTQYQRTQQTAQPLADALDIEPLVFDAIDTEAIASYIEEEAIGKTVLVVGHSNTVPNIISDLGAEPPLANIPEDDFDNLFVLMTSGNGQAAAGKTTYGDVSP